MLTTQNQPKADFISMLPSDIIAHMFNSFFAPHVEKIIILSRVSKSFNTMVSCYFHALLLNAPSPQPDYNSYFSNILSKGEQKNAYTPQQTEEIIKQRFKLNSRTIMLRVNYTGHDHLYAIHLINNQFIPQKSMSSISSVLAFKPVHFKVEITDKTNMIQKAIGHPIPFAPLLYQETKFTFLFNPGKKDVLEDFKKAAVPRSFVSTPLRDVLNHIGGSLVQDKEVYFCFAKFHSLMNSTSGKIDHELVLYFKAPEYPEQLNYVLKKHWLEAIWQKKSAELDAKILERDAKKIDEQISYRPVDVCPLEPNTFSMSSLKLKTLPLIFWFLFDFCNQGSYHLKELVSGDVDQPPLLLNCSAPDVFAALITLLSSTLRNNHSSNKPAPIKAVDTISSLSSSSIFSIFLKPISTVSETLYSKKNIDEIKLADTPEKMRQFLLNHPNMNLTQEGKKTFDIFKTLFFEAEKLYEENMKNKFNRRGV